MFFKNKFEKHMKKHALAPDKERYLTLGAVVMHMNEPTERVLPALGDSSDYQEVLSRFWDIEDRQYCLERIEGLLTSEDQNSDIRYAKLMPVYREKAFTGVDKTNFEIYTELLRGTACLPDDEIYGCETLLAWDLERAAFLARAGFNAGYVREDEVWQLLSQRITPPAKAMFQNWYSYASSYLLGRFFWSGSGAQADAVEAVAHLLLGLWEEYSLSQL